MLELGVALGASELQVIRFMPGGQGMKHSNLMLSRNEYEKMLDVLEEVCSRYRIPSAIGAPNIPCVISEDKYRNIRLGDCGAGINWLVVDPSGRVRICNHSPTIIGNLLNQDFKDIWDQQLLKDFRSHKVIPQECNHCEKKLECRGGCRAVAETYYGSLYDPDPLMVME